MVIPKNAIRCLDKGFIRLVDRMGGDDAIVQAARVSYGKGTRKISEDRGLIRYLMRHRHSTPFEMVELKFHAKMPIFVARQWVRHRTANINEYSLRYSEARDEFYIPNRENIHFQSKLSKQGRELSEVPEDLKDKVISFFQEISEKTFSFYSELKKAGIARELARAILPVNLYTEWYWKNDLHNIFHFLHLRLHHSAQYEIRIYANAMETIVKEIAPLAYEAFEDYVVEGLRFSNIEQISFKKRLPYRILEDILEDVNYQIIATQNKNKIHSLDELYDLYEGQGGTDSRDDFELKWNSGEIETGNIRELREFKEKLETFKKNAIK